MNNSVAATPESMAQKAFKSNSIVWSTYMVGTREHVRYADEILRLTTEAGKKK